MPDRFFRCLRFRRTYERVIFMVPAFHLVLVEAGSENWWLASHCTGTLFRVSYFVNHRTYYRTVMRCPQWRPLLWTLLARVGTRKASRTSLRMSALRWWCWFHQLTRRKRFAVIVVEIKKTTAAHFLRLLARFLAMVAKPVWRHCDDFWAQSVVVRAPR